MQSWSTFLRQRVRWASKSAAYPDWRLRGVVFLIGGYCTVLLLAFLSLPITGAFGGFALLILAGAKALADYHLLKTAARFFGKEHLMRFFWPSFLLYPLYFTAVGIWALTGVGYEWKGRRLK